MGPGTFLALEQLIEQKQVRRNPLNFRVFIKAGCGVPETKLSSVSFHWVVRKNTTGIVGD